MISSPENRSGLMGRISVALAGLLIATLTLLVLAEARPAQADSPDARNALEKSRKFLSEGNATAARTFAMRAIRSSPDWGAAHVQLAKAQVLLGNGLAAGAEVDRAADNGIANADLAALRARALLSDGQPRRALDALKGASPKIAVDVLRVKGLALARLGNLAGARDALQAAVAQAPKDAGAWTDLGRFRYVAGDLTGAIDAAAKAVELDPNYVQALVLRGELVRQQFGLMASLPWFEGALKRDPWDHDALMEYAATLGDVGRTRDMLAAVRKGMQARPGSIRGYYLQAVLAARAGNYELARAVLAYVDDNGIDSMPGALMLSGMLDLKSGAYQQAADKFGALVERQPTNITARKLYATALLRIDAAKNAITVMRPVVLRSDADSYSLTLVARALERINAHDEAGMYLDRSAIPFLGGSSLFTPDVDLNQLREDARTRPAGDPTTEIPLIRGLLAAKDSGAALSRAQAVAAANPGAPGGQVLVGDVAMLVNKADLAAQSYQKAADIRFDQPTMLRLVEALERAGKPADASKALALFLSQNPDNVVALRMAGHRQLMAGDVDGAIDTLEGLRLRLGNRDAALLAELAFAYASADDPDKAKKYGEAAYAIQPENPAVADAYGWALLQSGDSKGAVQLMRQASLSAPAVSQYRWRLALALVEDGQKDAARAELVRLVDDKGFGEANQAKALLAKLG